MPLSTSPMPAERRLSLILLLVLAGIAAILLMVQYRYDPGQWQALSGPGAEPSQELSGEEFASLGLRPLTPPERYNAETLSDKIDGKAELYLAAGFNALQTQRLTLEGASGEAFLERYVYDMNRYRNAFAVFSNQRRPERETLDLTPDAYQAANGLFMVHGRYYVEIIASDTSEALQAATLAVARRFVSQNSVPDEKLIETTLFPEEERVTDSVALVAANAFGLEDLDWVYTAQYRRNSHEALAFLSRRATAAEALIARDAFSAYFLEYGGEPLTAPAGLESAHIVHILDTYEIVLVYDAFLLGVHEAADAEQAFDLAARLLERIKEVSP
jgi:hypothetical protein